MPHVAFIESNTAGLRAAQELGYAVTAVAADPARHRDPHAFDGCDHVLAVDPADASALVAALAAHRDRHGLDGVLSLGPEHAHAAAVAARALGLPGADPDAVALAASAAATRRALAVAGVPGPRFAVAATVAQALAAAQALGYPCVVRAGAVADVVAGPAGVAAAAELSVAAGPVVVEESLVGPRYVVALVGARVAGTAAVRSVADGFAAEETVLPAPGLLPWQRRRVEAAAADAVRALGVDHGVCQVDVRLTGQGPRVSAVHAGVGAFGVPELVRQASGVDLTAAAVRLAAGAVPDLAARRGGAAGVRFVGAPRPGVLAGVRGLAQARLTAGVVAVGRTAEPGRLVGPSAVVAYLVVAGDEPWQVVERLAAVAAGVTVNVAPAVRDRAPEQVRAAA